MQCEKCQSQWDFEVHIPKILPCGHTVCQACLLSILNQSMASSELSNLKCPICQDEHQTISSKEDISNLKENQLLISMADKIENKKKELNINNTSISMSLNLNEKKDTINTEKILEGIKNCYFPICELHKNKANFFNIENNEIVYICNECLKNNIYNKLEPLPNLVMQNEIKINACKNRAKILFDEIDKIEEFLNNYQIQFEEANKKKIEDLFEYIQKIVKYNQTTANTLYFQCKDEQKKQISQKIEELNILRKELSEFEKQLNELQKNKLFQINPDSENQNKLEKIYNKLGNYINYENELNLFQIDVNIHEDIKESIFDLIQSAYEINVDYLRMENEELPNIKTLLSKNTCWPCSCGEKENEIGKIICKKCSKYRSLETYNNILFNPLAIRKDELTEFYKRRKHEEQIFKSILQRNTENEKDSKLYAIDNKWFNKWKTYVTNDFEEKILSNNEKYISDNKLIGILPPGEINNEKICVKDRNNNDKYKLKSGLIIQKDYYAINQLLWEWFKLNYGGGPEIVLGVSNNNNISNNYINSNYSNNNNFIPKKTFEKTDSSTIDNNDSVIVISSKENFIESKISDSQIQLFDSGIARDSLNKINTVDDYKFSTKFNHFRNQKEKTTDNNKNHQKIDIKSIAYDYIETFGNINNK